MPHKPVKYLVKLRGSNRNQPDVILLRTDNIDEARRVMSVNQRKDGAGSYYIDYTEKGLAAFAKYPRASKRRMYNNANMPGLHFTRAHDDTARKRAAIKNRRH